ncbi:hypothetical protein DWF00_05870 [Bosea caraganae]|uniref:Uncharacterized protein n=1 Tax=Bosea caraganae TaxID=2763117 RepID=A0A370L3G9_9HYPH|nr:hypothetical protein [Bosea caraganae]RDJ22890.1 hypothetical protein DWE98_17115 [Bosea caraganae]RDJ28670.1 hypothetical protein DWF00_05870 [Bosea caraganae]
MRSSLALALVTLVTLGQQLGAQSAERADHDRQISACNAWRERLSNTVRDSSGTGSLSLEDAAAANGLIEMIGRRCSGDDPQRMSQLFAIVLDTLSDQRQQP